MANQDKIKINRPAWNEDAIKKFWDYYSSRSDWADNYFSKMHATQLLELLADAGMLTGKYLDYGCGPGYLLNETVQLTESYGADPSQESVRQTNKRLHGRDKWCGCINVSAIRKTFKSNTFDSITCIETIEHLSDEILDEVMTDLNDLLVPGGKLLLTVPYNEDLQANMHYCPFCNSEFHRVQHQRTFDIKTLSEVIERHDFDIEWCKDIRLASYGYRPTLNTTMSFNIRGWLHYSKYNLLNMLDNLYPIGFPNSRINRTYDFRTGGKNLVAIAKKRY